MNRIVTLHFWLTVGAAIATPLPYGSVDSFWIAIWVLMLAATLALAPAQFLNARQRRVIAGFVGLWIAYVGIAFLQVLPDLPFLGNEAWRELNETLGAAAPTRISVRSSIPLDALGHVLLATLAFCNGFVVGAQKERARVLLDAVAYAGLILACYAIFAEFVMPSRLLFRAKTAYIGDMTGTFVNRNTAATFFGIASTLWLFSVIRSLRRIRFYGFKHLLIVPQSEAAVRSLTFRTVALTICLVALFGTHSRGGALALGLGLATSIALVSIQKGKLLLPLALSGCVLIAYWLGGSIGARVDSQGLFDGGRWTTYLSAWTLVTEHPWLGTGLGAFRDVFPAVRSAAFPRGVWEMAHNTILEIAVEMGIPMALAIIATALWVVSVTYRAALVSVGRTRADLLALASITVLAFAHSLTDFSLQIPGFLTPFAILVGAAMAQSGAETEKAPQQLISPLP